MNLPAASSAAGLDLLLPVYHPHPGWEDAIAGALQPLEDYFLARAIPLRVLLVSDGSPELAAAAAGLGERLRCDFRFIGYEQNRGKGYCLRYGVAQTSGAIQIYTDYDFPFGSAPIIAAWERLNQNADVVMGVRGSDYAAALPWRRRLISTGIRLMNRRLLGLPPEHCDTQAGFKGFNAAGRALFLNTTTESFLFDTEFILGAHRRGLRIAALPIQLRSGIHFSSFRTGIIGRELRHFLRLCLTRRKQP